MGDCKSSYHQEVKLPLRNTWTCFTVAGLVALAVPTLSACDGSKNSTSKAGATKVAMLLRSQGGATYFKQVAEGAKQAADKMHIDLTVTFTDSVDQQMSAVTAAINDGAKGLIVTIQDPTIGPKIAEKAAAAKVSLLATPDSFSDSAGDPVPVVELDGKKVGTDVGNEMGSLYQNDGWSSRPRHQVKIASIDLPKVATCNDRTVAAQHAFLATVIDFEEADIVHIAYDGSEADGGRAMSDGLPSQQGVVDWMVWSCNDEGVVGAIKALSRAGYGPDRVIGVGIGANLACDQWRSGPASAYRAAVVLDPKDNGKVAVNTMADHLTSGVALPATTLFSGNVVTRSANLAGLPCH
jgi:L-arabinose transport system substrate-binding protein